MSIETLELENVVSNKLKHIGYYNIERKENQHILFADSLLRKILVIIIAAKREKYNKEQLTSLAAENNREVWIAKVKSMHGQTSISWAKF